MYYADEEVQYYHLPEAATYSSPTFISAVAIKSNMVGMVI